MSQNLAALDISALEKMYLRETGILKFKLLSGAFWKDIVRQKNKAIELALAIHKKQQNNGIVCDNFLMEQL